MIRILIADDSAFMRKVLTDLFKAQPDFEVVGTAINGRDAVEKVKKYHPDLLTLDVQMPVMDGLNALAVIMEIAPMPVVMLSSLTKEGTDETIRALSLGAVDFISKAGGSISRIDTIEEDILAKCRAAAKANVKRAMKGARAAELAERERRAKEKAEPPRMHHVELPARHNPFGTKPATEEKKPRNPFGHHENPLLQKRKPTLTPHAQPAPNVKASGAGSGKLVAIGTSTGGPQALQSVITRLPGDLPCGVVVVQHMPPGFTKSLANRLDSLSKVSVKEAEDGDVIEPGHVYIAPGNYHMRVASEGSKRKIVLSQDPPVGNHRPAVNVLYDSVAPVGKNLVAVIMTGMGCDGTEGMKKIKAQGGYSIAQDESTSVVYGMPKSVVDAGLADEVRPVTDIARAIVAAVEK
ncbi:chemotaxis response regulator protein-glutamate methylesterase [uncultured Selenomonas sp.]|uniref:protein-glutamate methylesterase/protein-glutamine glutaminase n=1 Tax=uncultured Selenomonas sp. TaxID=159275 RepID=UPI0025EDBFF1|nr:chemotaxis response regulator protein-glutamate methylesterase [uncultured Selenomonas sp.]